MYLCPLDKAFPNYKDPNETQDLDIVQPQYPKDDSMKFNYIQANTGSFAMNMENKDIHYNDIRYNEIKKSTENTNSCQQCPYCNKIININALKKSMSNNTLDILAISALTILIYSIISGKS